MTLNPVLFPPYISTGAEGGPRFKTTVIGVNKGSEQRNIDWEDARGEWVFDRRRLKQADLQALNRFFYAHYGPAYSFLFKDWADYKARMLDGEDRPFLLTTSGVALQPVQLVKRYAAGLLEYVREINRPVEGTVTLYADGTPVDPGNYSIDYAAGMVTWDPGYAPAAGLDITWDGEFHVPVRFVDDFQKRRYLVGPRYEWNRISLIEVRNEPDVS